MRLILKLNILVCLLALPLKGQVAVHLAPVPAQQFLSSTGLPLSGGCVFSYISGTSTPQATYADSTGLIQNANPLILDSGGFGSIWLNDAQTYRITVKSAGGVNCASGTQQRQIDGVSNGSLAAILGTNNTWTGNQTYNGNVTYNGSVTLGTLTVGGAETVNGALSATAGGSLNGTFSGNAAFTGNNTHSGTETFTGTLTFTNHNNTCWAGPGATPTIDQAIASCTGFPGAIVAISPGYTGAESVNLTTNSVGYLTYIGDNHITVEDYRANQGTPGNGFTAPIYGIIYGGRLAGQRNRLGTSYYSHNETDSAAGATSFNWLDGTFSSIGGQYAGAINGLVLHDTVTVGSSVSPTVGTDSEIHMDATVSDNPLFHAWSYVGQALVSRNTATQKVQTATVYQAQPCSVIGGATASIANCYGFSAEAPTQGTARNASYHSFGDWMTEAATSWWAADAGTAFTIAASPTGITESGQTVTVNVSGGPCTFTTGQFVSISGVTNTAYNGYFTINSPGCNGTSAFTYFAPGTSNLAGSGTGTATGNNMRQVLTWGPTGNNIITHYPLADNKGEQWQNQAKSTTWFTIDSASVRVSNLPFYVGNNAAIGCQSSGSCTLGAAGHEIQEVILLSCYLGGAAGTTSPAACGNAISGKIAIPTSAGTTYTVNSGNVTANSIFMLKQTTDNSGLPSSPTCAVTANLPAVEQTTRSAGVSFTMNGLANPASITCFEFLIIN